MLQQISIYLLKVICISGLLFLYYHIALRNKQFHYYNRFYLLLTVVLSSVLPLLQLQWFTLFSSSSQTIHLYKIIYGSGEEDVSVYGNSTLSFEQIAICFLAVTSFVMISLLCLRIAKITRLKKKYPVQQLMEFDFINTDIQQAPFSFLKNIFWRTDISLQDETGRQILQHEITHIKQKHSWDKLFIQLLLCFYWMNPFYWLLKKELYLIHEFIADEEAVGKNDATAFAKMLLASQYGKFQFLPAQSIFYSPIKRRLIMLTTSKKPQFSYVRRLMVLPLIAIVICLFAFTVQKENPVSSKQKIIAAKPFALVVDAGHGGKDYGALGNGLYEKDLTLKIAEKIKALSTEYGIDVVLTRNSDVYMSPQEKASFANEQNADAFITLHLNAETKNKISGSGFEVYISKDNSQPFASTLLGSAILQSVRPDFQTPGALNTRNVGIWVLRGTNLPAALLECGYITNANDAKLLKDDATIELMAKNILQGVALYANNRNSITPQKVINAEDTIPPGQVNKSSSASALYVLDGKIVSKENIDKLDPNSIESISVLKDKDAIDKYGDKGKNGVVEIALKKANSNKNIKAPLPAPPPPPPPPANAPAGI